jgi:hypothetical protein
MLNNKMIIRKIFGYFPVMSVVVADILSSDNLIILYVFEGAPPICLQNLMLPQNFCFFTNVSTFKAMTTAVQNLII